MWQAKFLAYAQFKGFKDILQGKKTVATAETGKDLTPAQVKSNQEFTKSNCQAYSMLHMCVTDSVSFGAIYNAVTTQLPEGDAAKAWEGLTTIFKPVSSAKKHELE